MKLNTRTVTLTTFHGITLFTDSIWRPTLNQFCSDLPGHTLNQFCSDLPGHRCWFMVAPVDSSLCCRPSILIHFLVAGKMTVCSGRVASEWPARGFRCGVGRVSVRMCPWPVAGRVAGTLLSGSADVRAGQLSAEDGVVRGPVVGRIFGCQCWLTTNRECSRRICWVHWQLPSKQSFKWHKYVHHQEKTKETNEYVH